MFVLPLYKFDLLVMFWICSDATLGFASLIARLGIGVVPPTVYSSELMELTEL